MRPTSAFVRWGWVLVPLLLCVVQPVDDWGCAARRRRAKAASAGSWAKAVRRPLRQTLRALGTEGTKGGELPSAAEVQGVLEAAAAVGGERPPSSEHLRQLVRPGLSLLSAATRAGHYYELAMGVAGVLEGVTDPQVQGQLYSAYEKLCPLLVGEGLLALGSRCEWRKMRTIARLSPPAEASAPPPATVALLASSSLWDGQPLTLARAMHQQVGRPCFQSVCVNAATACDWDLPM
jgi:hypothetical protein